MHFILIMAFITYLYQFSCMNKKLSFLRIPRDIQQIVYCAAVAKGNDEIFQFVKDRYNDSTTSNVQRLRLLNALACSADVAAVSE